MNSFSIARLGILAFAAFLTGCTVVVEEEGPRPPRPDPRVCTQQYDPVCAQRGDRRRTFGNACTARAEGWRPIHPGQCQAGGPPPERPQACTMEYRPVCAARNGRLRTFGNACQANAEGWRIVRSGEC